MIVYFLVFTFFNTGYSSSSMAAVTIPQTYQTKEACEAAAISSIKDYKDRRGGPVVFTCVPWNQEAD